MPDPPQLDRPAGHTSDPLRRSVVRAVTRRATNCEWLVRTSGLALSAGALTFALAFVALLDSGGELVLITRPLPMRITLLLPYVIGFLTLSTTGCVLLAWRRRYWSLRTRIHQTVLAVFGIGFTWQLVELGFITF